MSDIDKIIAKGERAKQLLESDMFKETMSDIQAEMFGTFLSTSGDEGEARDACWALSNACLEIERHLRTHITNAEVEIKNRRDAEIGDALGGYTPWK